MRRSVSPGVLRQRRFSRQWLVTTVVGASAFVAVTVSFGYAWLPALLVSSIPASYLLYFAFRILRRFVVLVGRLELAWLLVLLATLSVDTLSTDQVFSGALRQAQLVRFALLVTALVALLPNLQKWMRGQPEGLFWGRIGRLYAVFVVVAVLSTVWSAGRLATVGKSFELAVGLLIVLAVAAQPHAERYLRRLFFMTLLFMGVLLSIVLVGYLANPSLFQSYILLKRDWILSGGPIPIASNAISRFGAILGTVALAYLLKRHRSLWERVLAASLVVYGTVFPLLAEGRTGIASFMLGALVLILLQRPVLGFILMVPGVLLIPRILDVFWEFFRRGQNLEQFSGLSGRVDWWLAGFDALMRAPFTGYGFGVGGRVAFAQLGREATAGLHNGFLETAAGVGLFGLAIWLIVFILVATGSLQHLLFNRQVEVFAVFITIGFATVLSSGAGGWMSAELGLFFILMALLDVEHVQRKRIHAHTFTHSTQAIRESSL